MCIKGVFIMLDSTVRSHIKKGMLVEIKEEKTEKIMRGYVWKILSTTDHKSGIKVILTSEKKGRVQNIPTKNEIQKENFAFYNRFFHLPFFFILWDKEKGLPWQHENQLNEMTGFIFQDKEEANRFLEKHNLSSFVFPRKVNRKKTLISFFSTVNFHAVYINNKRKITLEKLKEWEKYFTSF